MEQTKMNINYQASLSNVELGRSNSSFKTGQMRILAPDVVANGTSFTKEAILKALPSLKNIPVVGLHHKDREDFGGHEATLVLDEDGFSTEYNTHPFGVIPESANVWFEEVDGKEYLVTDILLWKREKAVKTLRKRKSFSVSMEIEVLNGVRENGILKITDFIFTAVCVLGKRVAPAFKSANIQVFSESQSLQTMLYELKEYMDQSLSGGETMAEEQVKDVIIEEEKTADSAKIDDVEINLDNQDSAIQADEAIENAPVDGEKVTEPVTEFEDEALKSNNEEGEEESKEATPDSTDAVVEETIVDPEPASDNQSANEPSALNEQAQAYEELQEQHKQLVDRMMEMNKQFEALTNELAEAKAKCGELETFKAEVLAERRATAEAELFAKFEALEGFDGFDAIKETALNYSVEELETQLYALAGKKLFAEKIQRANNHSIVLEEARVVEASSDNVFSLLDNYLKK